MDHKGKGKCFAYKRSRIDQMVIENITKTKQKQDKVVLKKIKELKEKLMKQDQDIFNLSRKNQQVRLKHGKKSK